MKVLIYTNKGKDIEGVWYKELTSALVSENIEFIKLEDQDLNKSYTADALFSLGGDGTILFLTEFASRNQIPIIGINTGRLGFLTEYERSDIKKAVAEFKSNALVSDNRSVIKVDYKGKSFYALNDVFLHHVYTELVGNMITDIEIKVDNKLVNVLKGDGIVVSTPTGSTAYSLSSGGPILTPDLEVFVITPIAAHTLNQRPIVYSADKSCRISIVGPARAGIFVDGKSIGVLNKGDFFDVIKSEKPVTFLRNKSFSFFKKLSAKLKNNFDGE